MGTIPAFPSFTSGENPTAAKLNQWKTAGDFWALTPRCAAYPTGVQSLASGATVNIGLDAELYDIVQAVDAATPMHDNGTNNDRIVIRTSGKYTISGQVQFASNATGYRIAQIELNGSGSALFRNTQSPVSGASTSVPILPQEYPLVAGDVVRLQAFQNSGAALSTVGGLANTFLRVVLTAP